MEEETLVMLARALEKMAKALERIAEDLEDVTSSGELQVNARVHREIDLETLSASLARRKPLILRPQRGNKNHTTKKRK